MSDFRKTLLELPIGALTIVARDGAITGVYFADHANAPDLTAIARDDGDPVLARARAQITEYVAGQRRAFDLPISAEGTTFQRAVWRALAAIPFGAQVSYAELARSIDHPRAIRAVGAANARNPLSILVPCHRVIGSSGALTGYAGGLAAKKWLLAHETSVAAVG